MKPKFKPKVGIGRCSPKFKFKHFRHQKWFKDLEGHVSMGLARAREIKFWI